MSMIRTLTRTPVAFLNYPNKYVVCVFKVLKLCLKVGNGYVMNC